MSDPTPTTPPKHHHRVIDSRDGGWRSRKMILTYLVMALGTIGYGAVGKWPSLATVYSEFCAFLLGASTIYMGGNTVVKALAAWKNVPLPPEEEKKK